MEPMSLWLISSWIAFLNSSVSWFKRQVRLVVALEAFLWKCVSFLLSWSDESGTQV